MNDDIFISTAEAGELLGIHKRTVQRRTDAYLKSQNIPTEQAAEFLEIREENGKKKYFVSKAFVLKHLVPTGESSSKKKSHDDSFATRQLLIQLDAKDLQLQRKDEQIAEKDKQLGELNTRLEESHVLLKNEQQLHGKTLQTKRPILSLGSSQSDTSPEEGSRRFRWSRIVGIASIGFATLIVLGSVAFSFM
jgi:beta-glucosidase-like glycosyl hydrolase